MYTRVQDNDLQVRTCSMWRCVFDIKYGLNRKWLGVSFCFWELIVVRYIDETICVYKPQVHGERLLVSGYRTPNFIDEDMYYCRHPSFAHMAPNVVRLT